MSNTPKSASEKAFQENFVRELEKYSWEAPDELDGNKHKVTVEDLILNWRKELNRLNAEILEGLDSEILALNTEITSLISNLEKVYE